MAVTDDLRMPTTLAGVRIFERAFARSVADLDADEVSLREVTALWTAFDRIERLASGAKTLLAARVDEAGDWKRAGARSAAEHMAKLGGTSSAVARRALENSKELALLPDLADEVRAGVLSAAQLEAIVPAVAADPSADDQLLGVAAATNITELRDECLRTQAAADPDRDATHRRIRAARCVRTYVDAEGAWNLHARGTVEQGAAFEAALEPIIDGMYAKARAEGRREPRAAYAFDAMLTLAQRGPGEKKPRMQPRFLVLVRVDAGALERGAVAGDEVCEIAGLGPIPARVARELMGDAIVKLVITKGVDVMNVTHLGRSATAAQRIALLWMKPKCANEACSSRFVQLDHRRPWAETKHTVLDETDPLCPHDHKLKTNHGWSLVEGKGRRAFVGPTDPVTRGTNRLPRERILRMTTPGTTPITDEYMGEMLAKTSTYTLVLLKAGPNYAAPEAGPVKFEHGRRNFALREEGVLAIVCPVTDDSELCGLGIFNASEAETVAIMHGDPGVQANVFTYEVHPVRSFPGDALP